MLVTQSLTLGPPSVTERRFHGIFAWENGQDRASYVRMLSALRGAMFGDESSWDTAGRSLEVGVVRLDRSNRNLWGKFQSYSCK